MLHELKIIPEYFIKVKNGYKTFKVRKDDRNYKQGDIVILKEYKSHQFTGREIKAWITYILRDRSIMLIILEIKASRLFMILRIEY